MSLEHEEHPRKRRPSRKRIALRWTGIVLVLAVLGTGGYVWYNYQRFVSGITHIDAITHSNAPATDADGTDQNILLVGDDHRPNNATDAELAQLGTTQDGGATNTDTMMVLHIPADGTLLNPVKLQNVLDAVSSSIETDPGLNLISLAAQLRGLNANNITTATIPILGTPDITVDGNDVSIVEVDLAAMPSFIASVIGNPSAYDAAKAAAVGDVTVTVLNGSDTDGLAADGTSTLTAIGFKTAEPGSTDTRATTTIEYPAGKEAQAKALAAYVPGAAVTLSKSAHAVTLILGADGVQVTAPSTDTSEAAAPPAPDPAPASPAKNFASGACIN